MISLDHDYLKLIDSSHVSPQTREVLRARLVFDDLNYQPIVLTPDELATLKQVITRIIPQQKTDSSNQINLAARLDQQLAEAKGDGWRYASLPSDLEAYRVGLSLIDDFATKLSAVPFVRLSLTAQDSLLDAIASGRIHSSQLDLKRWFEDLRANAIQIYVSHPQTLALMGYNGIADDPNGFVQIGINQHETWEPKSR